MRKRTAALVGGWGLALGAATGVSWAAVSLVGNEVSPPGSAPLSQAEVERRIHAGAGVSPASPSAGVASSAPSAATGTPVQRPVVVQGGTVVLTCTGNRITARTSPRSGYTVTEDPGSDGSELTISFEGDSHRSRVEGSCPSGTPAATVHESELEQDD
jgi:hypothetical protein